MKMMKIDILMLVVMLAMVTVNSASKYQTDDFSPSSSKIEPMGTKENKKRLILFEKLVEELIDVERIAEEIKFIKKMRGLEQKNEISENDFLDKLQNDRLKRRTFFIGKRSVD